MTRKHFNALSPLWKLRTVSDEVIQSLEKLLGPSSVITSDSKRAEFSKDEGHFSAPPPPVVVVPRSTSEVSEVLRFCNQRRLPVVPFGTGTGLEGGSVAIKGGVCLSMLGLAGGMTHLSQSHCSVRPSVTRKQLNQHIRHTGMFFPVDPGADASLCGMAATGASGTNAVRYGTMKENVRNLEVVLANGSIVHTRGEGRRPLKSAAGLNLTELFVGSEGILGVITEATLRLHPRPQYQSVVVSSFSSIASAVLAVVDIRLSSIPIARIELLDDCQVAASNAFSHLSLPEVPTLFLEFHCSTEEETRAQMEAVESICSDHSRVSFETATELAEIERLWTARHNAYYAALALRKGSTGFTTDVCVPISRLAEVVVETKKDLVKNSIIGTIVGHVGDGNFHVIIPGYKHDELEWKRIEEFSHRLVNRALAANGTCTGEHGIGIGKIRYLEQELGPATIELTRRIKQALDPRGIMNPGKVLAFKH